VYTVRLRHHPFAGPEGAPPPGTETKQLVVIR
jgi:hypothetical protein